MGFNQLDRPTFERYRLVKEDAPSEARESSTTHEQPASAKNTAYATKDDLAAIWDELDALKEKLKAQAEKKTLKARKMTEETEVSDDE
jgi:CRISPR/Cas system CSM-associated protein Csm4 (group 5 of RAMP superfamily)